MAKQQKPTLKSAREKGDLEPFIKARESESPGNPGLFAKVLKAMLGSSSVSQKKTKAPAASKSIEEGHLLT